MARLVFFPIILFGVIALAAGIVCALINIEERRRGTFYAKTRMRRAFRPVLIQGGKPEPAPMPVPAEDVVPAKVSGRATR